MTNLSVMMNWYAPESDLVEKQCSVCGDVFVVNKKQASHKSRCNTCQAEYDYRRRHPSSKTTPEDPVVSLAEAVIKHAIAEAKSDNSDTDLSAKAFIDDGGVELWLRALGLGVTPSMRRFIAEMAE